MPDVHHRRRQPDLVQVGDHENGKEKVVSWLETENMENRKGLGELSSSLPNSDISLLLAQIDSVEENFLDV